MIVDQILIKIQNGIIDIEKEEGIRQWVVGDNKDLQKDKI